MPAKWMSLEALREAKFSHKSDAFAFGVLLWEICSYGKPPWGAFGIADIADALDAGERLQGQPGAPLKMRDLCLRCWSTEPRSRPSFAQINDELQILPAMVKHALRASGTTDVGSARAADTPRACGTADYSTFSDTAAVAKPGTKDFASQPACVAIGPQAGGPVDVGGGTAAGVRPRPAAVLPEVSGYSRISAEEIDTAAAVLQRGACPANASDRGVGYEYADGIGGGSNNDNGSWVTGLGSTGDEPSSAAARTRAFADGTVVDAASVPSAWAATDKLYHSVETFSAVLLVPMQGRPTRAGSGTWTAALRREDDTTAFGVSFCVVHDGRGQGGDSHVTVRTVDAGGIADRAGVTEGSLIAAINSVLCTGATASLPGVVARALAHASNTVELELVGKR